MTLALHELVLAAARRSPDAMAVRGPGGPFTYRDLDACANRFARAFRKLGVVQGDRVGLWGEKSCQLVAAMQGCLRVGAAYVPIAANVPAARAHAVLSDCAVRCVVTDQRRARRLAGDQRHAGYGCLDVVEGIAGESSDPPPMPAVSVDDLAYILYTSGSTGQPKGVCVNHRGAMAFLEWAVATARIGEHSRLANHAAFSFDLSAFDLYAAFLTRASVSIVPELTSGSALQLVDFIRRERITVWDSVPSVLMLMMEHGGLLRHADLSIATVIFGGEVFPIRQLRQLREALPGALLLNFYGPTETNVCTWYAVERIDPDRTAPVPIGKPACGNKVWVADAAGRIRPDEGELVVEGPTVMMGYWGAPPVRNRRYATGDICRMDADGNFVFAGRQDEMVKIRGHRIELGDVEAALRTCPGVNAAAAVVIGEGTDARLAAFVVADPSTPPPGLVRLKEQCAARLPSHMVISLAWALDALPRTPNGKVDRRRLTDMARARV